jgi:hypothetical protein
MPNNEILPTIQEEKKCNFCLVFCKNRHSCPLCDNNMLLCVSCMAEHLEKHTIYYDNPQYQIQDYIETELTLSNKTGLF